MSTRSRRFVPTCQKGGLWGQYRQMTAAVGGSVSMPISIFALVSAEV